MEGCGGGGGGGGEGGDTNQASPLLPVTLEFSCALGLGPGSSLPVNCRGSKLRELHDYTDPGSIRERTLNIFMGNRGRAGGGAGGGLQSPARPFWAT